MKLNDNQRLRLLEHLVIRVMSSDTDEDRETMLFNTTRRTLKVDGQALQDVEKMLFPLLDGTRTIGEIRAAVWDKLTDSSLNECLEFLIKNRLVEEHPEDRLNLYSPSQLQPQLSLYHELGFKQQDAEERLANARIAIFGLGGSGIVAAMNLAASGIGFLRLCDNASTSPYDSLIMSNWGFGQAGNFRSVEAAQRIATMGSMTATETVTDTLTNDETVAELLDDVDLAIVATDAVSVNLAYRLNRLCLKMQCPLLPGGAFGIEGTLGPLVLGGDAPCYLCYRMRSIACAKLPEAELELEKFLDRDRRSQAQLRENWPIGHLLVGSHLVLETLKLLLGLPIATDGKLLHIDLINTKLTHNVVLKKPGCPHCSPARNS
ncbi:bacteriocin biosynthesis cyclodehydratase domain protein [Nostoc sp. PCC 7524]|uniref:TOMM precursor leader peptide-binding protein n=1 Tax=Nostoc sp. (strain ATCC 29411 / PCC 7524) TaxID=28072 RepID=UPI00029F26AA|nr:TOMM precursor leader peptide-binding protein [Nostoc sp. PCC 7524]AFY46990.1 bacteriocin biosynthesis cyclodehydratase domain protein [Nostoc sp. PCC 7524]